MMLKIFSLFLLLSLTFLVIPNTVLVNSLPPISNVSINRSYKVHVGDTAHYTIDNASLKNQHYLILPFFAPTAYHFVNLSKGDYLDLKVAKVFNDPNLGPYVSYDLTIVAPHNVTNLRMIHNDGFIVQAFDSTADLNTFINLDLYPNYINSLNGDMLTSLHYSNGTESSFIGFNGSDPVLILSNNTFNWKTGWVERYQLTVTFTNGSNYINLIIHGHPTTNVSSTLIGYTILLFEIGSLFVVVATIVIFVLMYRSYTKFSKNSDHSQSFYHYLRNRFHYTKKNQNPLTGSGTDKASQTIESILDETNDNTD